MIRLLFLLLGLSVSTPIFAQDHILTNTENVEDILLDGDVLWVASAGGIERFTFGKNKHREHYTTLHGLETNHTFQLSVQGGELHARSATVDCRLEKAKFICKDVPRIAPRVRAESFEAGTRIVETIQMKAGGRFIATFGKGVFFEHLGKRESLTPTDQICSNHITDIVEFKGKRFFGSFDDGLCFESKSNSFKKVEIAAKRINDLFVTAGRLFVASSRGLYSTRNGRSWKYHDDIPGGAIALARDDRFLVIASNAALRWMFLFRDRVRSAYWKPGGSTSIQDMVFDENGTVFLATEDRGVVRVEHARLRSERKVRVFDRAAGAPSSWVLTVEREDNGDIVAGTLKHGAFRIHEDGIDHLKLDDNWILRVRKGKSSIFFGTQGGAFESKNGKVTKLSHTPDDRIHELYEDRGRLYIATELGMVVKEIGMPMLAME